MAKVYYVKDGSYPQNMVDPLGQRIGLAELEQRLQDKDLHYLGSLPPEFNPHQPAHEARHVILELDMDEPRGQRLTRTGYYLVAQLSPTEAEALLFPPASNRVRTLFTSVRNEADRVGPTSLIGFTHVGSLALRAHSYARCGSGGWSS